jgi:hypothetical protein
LLPLSNFFNEFAEHNGCGYFLTTPIYGTPICVAIAILKCLSGGSALRTKELPNAAALASIRELCRIG